MKQLHFLLLPLFLGFSNAQAIAQTFQWAIGMGGPDADAAQDLYIDPFGNVFMTGRNVGTADFDPGPGVFNLTETSIFFAKYGPAGNLLWAKAITSGSFGSSSLGMTGDPFGNILLTGHFAGIYDFDPGPGMHFLNSNGGSAAFLAKYDPDGNLLWAKSWDGGGSVLNRGWDVETDPAGNIWVGGFFNHTVDFDPGPAIVNRTSAGEEDVFISKFDAAGNFIWVNALGGVEDDGCLSLTVDAAGQVVATGYFAAAADFDPGSGLAVLSASGDSDAFVAKYTADGVLVWVHAIGGNDPDRGESIEINASGFVVLTGRFSGTVDFDPGPGVVNLFGGIFLARFDPDGNLDWAKKIGGGGQDHGDEISLDGCSNIFVTGYFDGIADFDPGPAIHNLTAAGALDAFLAKYDSLGTFIWAHPVGGSGNDNGTHVQAVSDTVYLTGYFENTADFDPGPASFPLTSAGGWDVFIAKYTSCLPVEHSISATICDGESYLFDGDTLTIAGDYSAVFQNSICCDSIVNLNLAVLPALQGTSSLTACDGEVISVGGLNFMNDTLVCLNLLAINGCDSLHCYLLSFRDTFLQLQSVVICEGESVVVGNNTYTEAGVYTDVFTNQFNCDSTIRTELIIRPPLQLFFEEDSLRLSADDSIQLRPQSDFVIETFFWTSTSSDFCQSCLEPFVNPGETTSYTITAYDENGCSATAAIDVLVDLKLSVYLPNAFSPNDDGINDHFLPLGGEQLRLIRRLQVFDRWGGLLFDQTNLPPNGNTGWDGRADGRPLQSGVYVYLAEIELIDGSTTLMSGEVLLIR